MDVVFREKMEQAGMDVDLALDRLMGNESLLKKMVLRFETDPTYFELKEAMDAENCEKAFAAAHTLKGVCANLSMLRLEEAVSRQVECLRAGDLAAAVAWMPHIRAAYAEIIRAIQDVR